MPPHRPVLGFIPAFFIKPTLTRAFGFYLGLFCHLFAFSMFFYFPGVEDWTFSALHPFGSPGASAIGPDAWIHLLMVFAVVLPGVSGPVLLIRRARSFGGTKLILGSLALAGLHFSAAAASPLLYGRVALIALLSGQLLALGKSREYTIPFNWIVYLGFIVANVNFPDAGILAGANILAGSYLFGMGMLLLSQAWKRPRKVPAAR